MSLDSGYKSSLDAFTAAGIGSLFPSSAATFVAPLISGRLLFYSAINIMVRDIVYMQRQNKINNKKLIHKNR